MASKTITSINSGEGLACAVASGKAYCWGNNYYGQFGDNTNNNSAIPIAVNTDDVLSGKTVTSISAGIYNTCAVADNQAYCWGTNWDGELGINTTIDSLVPAAVITTGALSGKTILASLNRLSLYLRYC